MVKARNEVFLTQDLTEKTHYIASTGIGGRHPDPQVTVQMDAYAINGIQPAQIQFLYATTHLNPTYEYGVSFERGTCVKYGDRRQVFISGTASINNKGEVVYPGDVRKQTNRMWEMWKHCLKKPNVALMMYHKPSSICATQQTILSLKNCLTINSPICPTSWYMHRYAVPNG